MFCGVVLAAALLGGGCGAQASYGVSYGTSYSYNYGYQAPVYVPYVAVKAKVIPVATEYEYGQPYGALVGQDIRADYRREEDRQSQQALLEELRNIRKALASQPPPQEIQQFQAPQYAPQYGPSPQQPQAAPQQPLYAPQPPSKGPAVVPGKGSPYNPAPQAPQIPQPNPASFPEDPTQSSNAQDSAQIIGAIMGNHCAACHDEASKSGGRAFFDQTGNLKLSSLGELKDIYRAVVSGKMPPKRALPPGERTALEDAIIQQFQQARR